MISPSLVTKRAMPQWNYQDLRLKFAHNQQQQNTGWFFPGFGWLFFFLIPPSEKVQIGYPKNRPSVSFSPYAPYHRCFQLWSTQLDALPIPRATQPRWHELLLTHTWLPPHLRCECSSWCGYTYPNGSFQEVTQLANKVMHSPVYSDESCNHQECRGLHQQDLRLCEQAMLLVFFAAACDAPAPVALSFFSDSSGATLFGFSVFGCFTFLSDSSTSFCSKSSASIWASQCFFSNKTDSAFSSSSTFLLFFSVASTSWIFSFEYCMCFMMDSIREALVIAPVRRSFSSRIIPSKAAADKPELTRDLLMCFTILRVCALWQTFQGDRPTWNFVTLYMTFDKRTFLVLVIVFALVWQMLKSRFWIHSFWIFSFNCLLLSSCLNAFWNK